MRWLVVSKQHHPAHGGIGTYVQRFCSAARSVGWHVELLTQPGTQWPLCARVHETSSRDMHSDFALRIPDLRSRHVVRPYRYAQWSLAVADRLRSIDGDFDVIEFVDCQAEGHAAITCPDVRRRHIGSRFIVHAHTPMWIEEGVNGCDEAQFGRSIYHHWERQAIAEADGVIVTSNVLRRAIQDVAEGAIIPYPVMEDRHTTVVERPWRIVCVGSVQPRKGVDIWAKSLGRVLRAQPRVSASLIGPDTCTAPDGLSMAAYVQRLIDPRVIDRFDWRGSMPHDKVREIIANAALLVVPSRLESFSFVAAEAIIAGTPVLVSQNTGIAEHVPSLRTVASDDAETWAEAQIEVLRGSASDHERCSRSRIELLSSCSPQRVLAQRAQFIERVQARSGSPVGSNAMLEFCAEVESGCVVSSVGS